MATTEQILSEISLGLHDHGLAKIKEAVDTRVSATRLSRTVRNFPIGTRVRFNDRTGTKYMIGQLGTVSGIKVKKVVITLDTPVGRFDRGNGAPAKTVCPIEILDLV